VKNSVKAFRTHFYHLCDLNSSGLRQVKPERFWWSSRCDKHRDISIGFLAIFDLQSNFRSRKLNAFMAGSMPVTKWSRSGQVNPNNNNPLIWADGQVLPGGKYKRNEFPLLSYQQRTRSNYTPRRTTRTTSIHIYWSISTYLCVLYVCGQNNNNTPKKNHAAVKCLLFVLLFRIVLKDPIRKAPPPKLGPSKGSMKFYYALRSLLQLDEVFHVDKFAFYKGQFEIFAQCDWDGWLIVRFRPNICIGHYGCTPIVVAPDPQCWILVVLLVLSLLV